MDKIDEKIITNLKANGRMSWQEIGRELHLSGQAVAARVQKMLDEKIIDNFTIEQTKMYKHFITVYMQNSNFEMFERFLLEETFVEKADKVTGDGCYQLTCSTDNQEDLNNFLEKLLRYGRYKVLTTIRKIK